MTQNAPPIDETIPCQGDYLDEFDREIAALEQTLCDLKHRHLDTQLAAQEQVVLVRQRNELKQKGINQPELQLIRSRLEELDLILESRLLNEWRLMWEPFWQAVRFGGLGIAIGWFIASWGR